MTTLDWLIVAWTLIVALYGFLQGFLVGALSLGGFALGAVLGTRLGPELLPGGSHSPYAPLFGLVGALLAGAILAVGFEGIGARMRSRVRLPGFGLVDGALGALLTACVALGVAWVAGAAALSAPGAGELRREVRASTILRSLNELLPPSGPVLNALARFDPLPRVRAPEAEVAAPARGVAAAPGVRAARGSVVRVLGTACGLGVEGSGWVAPGGLVVTSAHVVAGQDDTTVLARGDGQRLPVTVAVFSPRDDVAVLRVPALGPSKPLALAPSPGAGSEAAILGFPHDGPFRSRAARLGDTRTVLTQDAYGRGPVSRLVLSFRGRVEHGNSGGPLVDAGGRVAGTVFAATSGVSTGGFAVPNQVVAGALARARAGARAGTGPCAT